MRYGIVILLMMLAACAGSNSNDDDFGLPDDARQIALTYEAIEGFWGLDTDASDALPIVNEQLWIAPKRDSLSYTWLLTSTQDAGGLIEYRRKLSICDDRLAGFNATCTEQPMQVLVTPDTLYVLDDVALRVYRRL